MALFPPLWLSLLACGACGEALLATEQQQRPVADPTRPRRVAALMAGFVADAAAMPLHWVRRRAFVPIDHVYFPNTS